MSLQTGKDHFKEAYAFLDQYKTEHIKLEELRETLTNEIECNNGEVIAAIIYFHGFGMKI